MDIGIRDKERILFLIKLQISNPLTQNVGDQLIQSAKLFNIPKSVTPRKTRIQRFL